MTARAIHTLIKLLTIAAAAAALVAADGQFKRAFPGPASADTNATPQIIVLPRDPAYP